MSRARARAKIASREKFALYAQSASKNLRQVLEQARENRFAYDKRTSGGRFLSVDPVVTDANSSKSFNRYFYANNNPFKYIDPDGRNPLLGEAQPYQAPHAELRAMLTSVFGGSEKAAAPVETGTVTKSTLTVSFVEVSRTTVEGGGGSTYVGARLTPGYAFQTTVEGQAKVSSGGSSDQYGATVKTSASAGVGLIGVTGSIGATATASGVSLQTSGGVVGAANNKGGIFGVRPPTVGFGITFKDKPAETRSE